MFLWCCLFLQIRIQAIRGFPLLGKDTEFVSKIADVLGQLLTSGMDFLYFFLEWLLHMHIWFSPIFQRKMWSVMLFIKRLCPLYDKMSKVRLQCPSLVVKDYIIWIASCEFMRIFLCKRRLVLWLCWELCKLFIQNIFLSMSPFPDSSKWQWLWYTVL